ncbi:hypothetical protein BD770DRAFT_391621, partial [Pilaira anomala]
MSPMSRSNAEWITLLTVIRCLFCCNLLSSSLLKTTSAGSPCSLGLLFKYSVLRISFLVILTLLCAFLVRAIL